ncbi:hypothetical protein B0F90DRAFT_1276323 [Multifurca ochricompacta]|uniref:DUF6535 domain-containing protein n=1 Tax=Multifurca ochricompacta TaxID=376703 RepID=A0AAD4M067_9AGAM|nr:hypothetical protein B0F90DRAFT_1276323 [Multifurca ochricompacta]
MAMEPPTTDLVQSQQAPSRIRKLSCVVSFKTDSDGTSLSSIDEKGRTAAQYGDTSSIFWKLYSSEAEANDEKLVHNLAGDTDSMLILNGLFSSIVSTFIIESYKKLQPDTGQQTVELLTLLVSQSNSTQSPSTQISDVLSFTTPAIAIRMNILMYLSLFFSLTSVLASAFIQQWCREYMKYAYPRAAPHKRGRVRTFLFKGLNTFQVIRFMYGVRVLLHLSIFLFFWAVSYFLDNSNTVVGAVSRYCLIALMAIYLVLSVSPMAFNNSPYHTALTPPFQASLMILLSLFRAIWRCLRRRDRKMPLTRRKYFDGIRFNRGLSLLKEAEARAGQLDSYAMKWLFTKDDFSDLDMDKYLDGLPGYIDSSLTDRHNLRNDISAEYILDRIKEHFMTCATSFELSEEACLNRVSVCVNSLRLIFRTSSEPHHNKTKAHIRRWRTWRAFRISSTASTRYAKGITRSWPCAHHASGASLSKVSSLSLPNIEGIRYPIGHFPSTLFPCTRFSVTGMKRGTLSRLQAHTPSRRTPTTHSTMKQAMKCGRIFCTTDL